DGLRGFRARIDEHDSAPRARGEAARAIRFRVHLHAAEVYVRLAVGVEVAAILARGLQEPFAIRTGRGERDISARRENDSLHLRRRPNELLGVEYFLRIPTLLSGGLRAQR